MNIYYPEDLENEQRYIELIDDVLAACQTYGEVVSISIPRPTKEQKKPSGLGRVFVEFKTVEMAKECWQDIVHKRYDNRSLFVGFYSETKYANRSFGYVAEENEDEDTQVEEVDEKNQ